MAKSSIPTLFIILFASLTAILAVGLAACYWTRGWLTIQNAADLAQIFGSLAVGLSLLFIAIQLRQQTRLARGSNSQSFVNASSNFVLAVGCNGELMKLYAKGGATFDRLPDETKAQYRYLVGWWLTFYENVVYQNGIGLLDTVIYDAWMKDMSGFIRRRCVEKVWDELKGNYSREFVNVFQPLIEARLKESQTAASTAFDQAKENTQE